VLFGKQDPTEEPGLANASLELCHQSSLIWFEHARHWLQREESARVTEEIMRFISPVSVP
jgi:epoxide hydrolase 4